MTGAERAKLSRIRAKSADKRTPEDMRWVASLETAYRQAISLDLPPSTPVAPPSTNPSASPVPGPVSSGTGAEPEWDRVVDATAGADDDDDDDDDDDNEPVLARAEGGAANPGGDAPGVAGAEKPIAMTLEVARGTAASAFLLMQSGWSIFGDRESKDLEPTSEEMRLLTKVVASYAQRFGWTQEIDDAILLGTVLLVYNARASRAPRKKPKLPKDAK